ncbi:MAG: dephospho-CoA kinase [Flavobacteriales bacterium]|nr:dephospho-CoA kinase [Flavobacteriales bacterium]
MKVVGITGGIGSGKTTACKVFEQLGVPVYYADNRAKELMVNDKVLKDRIVAAFGDEAYINGRLNRAYLAAQVFNSKEKLSVLNGIVHPAVADDFDQWLEQQTSDYVLKEAAILFESGAYQDVDISVLVIAPEQLRIERVMARDGASEEDALRRMKNQWTQERKAKLADHILNNDGSELLIPQVLELHRKFSSK